MLLASDGRYSREDSGYSVDQHIGGEKDHQREHRWTGKSQQDASEDNAQHASQREQPPILSEAPACGIGSNVRATVDSGARPDMLPQLGFDLLTRRRASTQA